MPMAMWVLFAGSFQKQLTAVLGYDAATAKAMMTAPMQWFCRKREKASSPKRILPL